MFKKIFLLFFFLFYNIYLLSIDRNRMTIGVTVPTPNSSYFPDNGSFSNNSFNNTFTKNSRATVINQETYHECNKKCLLKGENCLDKCLCQACWSNSIGGPDKLTDYCNCIDPDKTNSLHF